ncbi:MAG: hypothetical protein OJF49_003162 [Ktedonobacterales bacterium]|jgi:protein SCO1/2|nr:MAG: hypothetical protein OJF49_003162 [Ktedonobacterales bacterium]
MLKLATMNQRTMSRVITIALVVLLGGTVLLFNRLADTYANHSTTPPATTLQGTDLGKTPAPDIQLKDQNGQTVSLSQFRGQPVVLTFFDSLCPHAECPLTAQYMDATASFLGADTNKVIWLGLSMNPKDTPTTVQAFMQGNRVTFPLRYLLGTQEQLAPLWSAYHMSSVTQADGIVIHTTGVYIIDQQGRERIFLDEGFDPKELASDLRILLGS